MTNTTPSLRHDIENITDEVIIVEQPGGPERFTRAEHPTRIGALSVHTFRRVDGGYNASAVHLAERGFIVEG